MVYFNPNPKQIETDDCVIRAMCCAFFTDWHSTYKDMFEVCEKEGLIAVSSFGVEYYLKCKGYDKQTETQDRTVRQFAEYLNDNCDKYQGNKVIAILDYEHITCIKQDSDGQFCNWDIADCSDDRVTEYWII